MKVVWSDEAVYALVALETKLAQRYSAERAAEVVDELVRRIDRLEDHAQLAEWCRNTAINSFANW
jgi:plasmid stabilization system protein ParE